MNELPQINESRISINHLDCFLFIHSGYNENKYNAYFCAIVLKFEGVKLLINIFSIVTIILFFVSCGSDKKEIHEKKKESETIVVAENLKQVKVDIKGMTCEIGCARLIQSKLYKTDGVKFANISYEDSSGVVSFDQNRLSEDDLIAIIEKTAGGDIYSVSGINEVDVAENENELQ